MESSMIEGWVTEKNGISYYINKEGKKTTKIKEDINVYINDPTSGEQLNTPKESLTDISFVIDSGDGKSELNTSRIVGCLKALIIDTDSPVQLKISFKNYPSIKIYESSHCYGSYYIVPIVDGTYRENKLSIYTQLLWSLSDELKIEINGKPNTKVNITFRME